jgi:hypothetical protein
LASAGSCPPEAISNAGALLPFPDFIANGNPREEPFFITWDGSEVVSPFISTLFCSRGSIRGRAGCREFFFPIQTPRNLVVE